MTLYEFNILSLEEKQATVWERGIFLDNYITEGIKINCYAIDKFFVEVVYDAQHNVITEVRSFKYGHSLSKYVQNINRISQNQLRRFENKGASPTHTQTTSNFSPMRTINNSLREG